MHWTARDTCKLTDMYKICPVDMAEKVPYPNHPQQLQLPRRVQIHNPHPTPSRPAACDDIQARLVPRARRVGATASLNGVTSEEATVGGAQPGKSRHRPAAPLLSSASSAAHAASLLRCRALCCVCRRPARGAGAGSTGTCYGDGCVWSVWST